MLNPAKKQAKSASPGSVAKCIEIDDPLERDKCIIQKLEQRIDDSVKRFGAALEETTDDLKRDFKANLKIEIEDKVVPLLKSADDNAIGAIQAYSGMVKNVHRIGLVVDEMRNDFDVLKRQSATKDDLASVANAMATKEDLKQFATKDDLARVENSMVMKDEFNALSGKVDSMDKKLDKLLAK